MFRQLGAVALAVVLGLMSTVVMPLVGLVAGLFLGPCMYAVMSKR